MPRHESNDGWYVFDNPDAVHVVPRNDTRDHNICHGEHECWCNPAIEDEGERPIVIHNAADGREAYETLN